MTFVSTIRLTCNPLVVQSGYDHQKASTRNGMKISKTDIVPVGKQTTEPQIDPHGRVLGVQDTGH